MKKYSLFSVLLGNIWLLSTFVNSSFDIKINIKIVQNCCRNLAVKGLSMFSIKYNTLYFIYRIDNSILFISLEYSHWVDKVDTMP